MAGSDDGVIETDGDTRTRILEAGIDCWLLSGTAKTSVRDVAEAAGLSRATLYRYFPDRTTLMRAIRRHEQDSFSETVRGRVREVRTLRDAVAVMAEVAADRALRYRSSSSGGAVDDPGLVLLTRPSPTLVRALIGPFIDYAAATGQLVDEISSKQASDWISLCLSTVYWLPRSWPADLSSARAIGGLYADRICGGIVAPACTG
jgi:AcrR family transcriptional regulator